MKANRHGNYPCPCCSYYTFDAPPDNSFDICPVCYWEDDGVQLREPTYAGGANKLSLEQARLHYAQYGACEPGMQRYVRAPLPDELPDQA
ncbi:hydrolase [Hymenobacter gummosus]|uniref:Hydrolase n=1 Tax=Hymenobacter gummosus TaxID=1776032 RepID=A0A431U5C6_9BACT|nr:CPCC family cysteine-rich protein [Hymenobacter gummosus]RTQ51386.1 hydrolase [Hymenobacter gummosus]